jgi:hypothetical protein
LPDATGHSFWLRGSAWEYPTFSNAETLVSRLARQGLIVRNPVGQTPGEIVQAKEQLSFLDKTAPLG